MEGLFGDSKLGELEEKIEVLLDTYRGMRSEKEQLLERLAQLEAENRQLRGKVSDMENEKDIVMSKVRSILEKVGRIEV